MQLDNCLGNVLEPPFPKSADRCLRKSEKSVTHNTTGCSLIRAQVASGYEASTYLAVTLLL